MKHITISKGQHISDIEPFKSTGIPTNSIIHKTVPGCGITRFEIEYAKHHSIIIEPNVPVIKGKVQEHNRKPGNKHKQILGVHKGVDVDDIKAYLLKDIEYKKILTTPEGFIKKVLKAFAKDPDIMLDTFFLLYDECERIITDVSYRGDIAAPLDIFFEFKKKAMVSATTLPFLDERFDHFEKYEIVPDYEFSRPLEVIQTNSVMASFITHIQKLQSDHICVFVNSTSLIAAMIKNLGIESESKVFCAQESVVKILERGLDCASSNFESADMLKYNFFTSRYFSAVDIELDYKPDVIMMTDVYFADHSILDPHTECIQIPGRFRNFESQLKSLTHISNFNPNLKAKSEEEAHYYLEGCFDTYNGFVQSHAKATNPGSKDTFAQAIKCSMVDSFYIEGKVNKAMVANYIHEERVKGYYQNIDKLKAAYEQRPLHFKTTYDTKRYSVGDDDLYNLRLRQSTKEKYQVVAKLLDKWTPRYDDLSFTPYEMLNTLRTKYPTIARAFDIIGLEGLENAEYERVAIKKAVSEAEKVNELKRLAPYVYALVKDYSSYDETDLAPQVERAFKDAKTTLKSTVSQIVKFFEGRRSTSKGKNVYVLKGKKFT